MPATRPPTPPRPPTRAQRLAARFMAGGILLALLLVIGAAVYSIGASRIRTYNQSTPDDVIRAAVEMIKNGDTRRLTTLFYADGPDMRAALNKLGHTLESMQRLSAASARAFPAEFAKLQDDALAAANDPKNKGLVGQIMAEMGDVSGTPGRAPSADDVRAGFSALLADPFGWVDRNAARLSAVKTADDTAAVLFDGEPAIPVVGLPMKLEDGKWYFVLPINMPPISNYAPRTRQQWSIIGSVFQVLENATVALEAEVSRGGVTSLKNLTDKFQEKVLLPILMAFGPYAKEMDVRSRVERRTTALKSRQRAWVEARKKTPPADITDGRVSPKLLDAVGSLTFTNIEAGVRANKPLGIDKLSDPDFEELIGKWLREAGLTVNMAGDLTPEAIDKQIEAWRADRKAKAAAKKP